MHPMETVSDVMVDTETLGTSPGSVLLAIGAVAFDPTKPWNMVTGQEIANRHRFTAFISMESCLDAGLRIDPGTLRFWMDQDLEARKEAFHGEEALADALRRFAQWLIAMNPTDKGVSGVRLWSHGAPFDAPLLAAAYKAIGDGEPWEFRNIRDTRTVFDLAGIRYSGKHHKVIDDCMAQCEKVCEGYSILGLHRDAPAEAA